MVQLGEGLWLHRAGARRRRLRPPCLCHGGGVQDPERGRPRQLRRGGGTEGSPGQERRQDFLSRQEPGEIIEQHRVHLIVAHGVGFSFLV